MEFLKAANHFWKKNSIVAAWQNPKYVSGFSLERFDLSIQSMIVLLLITMNNFTETLNSSMHRKHDYVLDILEKIVYYRDLELKHV